MLVDSHCHLDFPDFAKDCDEVINRARAAGVGLMVTIGTRLSGFEEARAIAERHDDVVCSVGVHPHHAAEELEQVSAQRLVALARHPKVVAIGESGLDYHYDHSPRDLQQASFRAHIQACLETGLPLVVHTREAEADTMRILQEEAGESGLTGVMHCFTGSQAMAEEALAAGLHISFSGILTFKNSEALREIARLVPFDRLLVETDAPYLAPVPQRGRRNEPAFVAHTAAALAAVKAVSPEEIARRTTANFVGLFRRAAAVLEAAG